MSLIDHAHQEYRAAGYMDEHGKFNCKMQQLMCTQVDEILKLFSSHGHSGFSVNYAISMLTKLLKQEPLVPLTGEDWEWEDVSNHSGVKTYQNKRCSHVFKQADRFNGQAYDINGKVFTKDGSSFRNGDSFVRVVFPYTPTIEYVEVKS